MPSFLDLLMRGNLAKGWIARERGCQGTWKVSDDTKRDDQITRGLCSREGKVEGWICFGH